MNNFLVSARKYRPNFFHEIKGQDHIVTTIQNAIKHNQIASAFLFCGTLGSGKTSLARILAKALNCQKTTPLGEPCSTCQHCTQRTPLNIHELDAASHNSAEDMRKIVEQIRYCPPNGKKMIIIIDETHMLSNAALNVLLKPLEDTPAHVVFMLITTEKHKIIPTILSRCQIFDFHAISTLEIQKHLQQIAQKENITCDQEAIQLISEKANGSLRNALSMFDLVVTFGGKKILAYKATLQHLNLLETSIYFSITDALYTGNIAHALIEYDKILRTGFDGLFFVTGLGQHLRNLLLAQTTQATNILHVPKKDEKTYIEKATQIHPKFIYQALALIQNCELNYKTTIDPRLHVEISLINISQINKKTQQTHTTQPNTEQTPQQKIFHNPTTESPLIKTPSNTLSNNIYTPVSIKENTEDTTIASEPPPAPLATSKKRTITIPTIKALQEKIQQNENTTSSTQKEKKKPKLTLNIIQKHWTTYTQTIESSNLQGYQALQCPLQLNNQTIVATLHNPANENVANALHPNLLSYLQKKLQTTALTLIFQTQQKKPYSDQEKLNDLIQKHNPINYLQQQLELTT